MRESILTSLTEQIATALATERDDGDRFGDTAFTIEWDFEGRVKDPPQCETEPSVRVVVPRRWHVIRRFDRGSLERIAVVDIDVRLKLGAASQDAKTNEVEKGKLARMVDLVETIHDYFFDNAKGRIDFDLGDDSYTAVWAGEMVDAPEQSRILVAYSERYMRDHRVYFGVCREVFQVLEKGSED